MEEGIINPWLFAWKQFPDIRTRKEENTESSSHLELKN